VGSVYLNERKKKDWKILYLYVCMLFCWIYFLFIIIIHVGIIKRFNCFLIDFINKSTTVFQHVTVILLVNQQTFRGFFYYVCL